MASKEKKHFLSKLPIVGQYQEDKTAKKIQENYFATLHAESSYLEPEPTVWGWIKSQGPTKDGVLTYISDTFPCSRWVCNYNLTWLLGDLIAGITVGAVVIPQGMAYAKLAHLPVQYGLYTSFIGGLVYWVFGTSKDIAIGPVAVASIITGTIVADLEEQFPQSKISPHALAGIVAMFSGAVIALLGALRLGWLVDLMSFPALASFITGSAITITMSQVPALLGIRKVDTRKPAVLVGVDVLKRLPKIRIDAAFGISALVLLYVIKWTCATISRKRPSIARTVFFISTLRTVFVIILFTILSFVFNRSRRDNPMFRILGYIPRGLQVTPLPSIELDMIKSVLGELPGAAIVLLLEHIAIGKELGRINGYTTNPNSELLAVGAVNIFGPMLGAYAATGSFSRSAINSKAGARTPMAGMVTAMVVITAIYTLTPVFFFVPTSALAAVIIHAIGDMITPPSRLYSWWCISPLDVLVFVIGLTVTLVNSIEHGIFAVVGLSLALLLVRIFQAHGSFLGKVKIRTMETHPSIHNDANTGSKSVKISRLQTEETIEDYNRSIFLPLDKNDGSNPRIELEAPYPGVFIFRLREGFKYANCSGQLDEMVQVIEHATVRGEPLTFEKPGDRPWNIPKVQHIEDATPDTRPTLKAIILDFSSVDNVDLTSIQYLVDVRHIIERHAAPHLVQWHFACIWNPWAKRALASAGFGYPSFEGEDGKPNGFKPIYSLAEMSGIGEHYAMQGRTQTTRRRPSVIAQDAEAGNLGAFTEGDKLVVETVEVDVHGEITEESMAKMTAVHGINRPFFHVDIQSALTSVVSSDVIMEAMMMQKIEEKEHETKEE